MPPPRVFPVSYANGESFFSKLIFSCRHIFLASVGLIFLTMKMTINLNKIWYGMTLLIKIHCQKNDDNTIKDNVIVTSSTLAKTIEQWRF